VQSQVVDDRYSDFEQRVPGAMGWVADDFFGAGCVVADAAGLPGDWRALDLAAVGGVMEINGVEVGRGVGADIIHGHPLEALVWLAAKFSERGETSPRRCQSHLYTMLCIFFWDYR
jgi:2-keto-4-pentenoate hydratase